MSYSARYREPSPPPRPYAGERFSDDDSDSSHSDFEAYAQHSSSSDDVFQPCLSGDTEESSGDSELDYSNHNRKSLIKSQSPRKNHITHRLVLSETAHVADDSISHSDWQSHVLQAMSTCATFTNRNYGNLPTSAITIDDFYNLPLTGYSFDPLVDSDDEDDDCRGRDYNHNGTQDHYKKRRLDSGFINQEEVASSEDIACFFQKLSLSEAPQQPLPYQRRFRNPSFPELKPLLEHKSDPSDDESDTASSRSSFTFRYRPPPFQPLVQPQMGPRQPEDDGKYRIPARRGLFDTPVVSVENPPTEAVVEQKEEESTVIPEKSPSPLPVSEIVHPSTPPQEQNSISSSSSRASEGGSSRGPIRSTGPKMTLDAFLAMEAANQCTTCERCGSTLTGDLLEAYRKASKTYPISPQALVNGDPTGLSTNGKIYKSNAPQTAPHIFASTSNGSTSSSTGSSVLNDSGTTPAPAVYVHPPPAATLQQPAASAQPSANGSSGQYHLVGLWKVPVSPSPLAPAAVPHPTVLPTAASSPHGPSMDPQSQTTLQNELGYDGTVTYGQAAHISSSGPAASPQASPSCSTSPQAEPRTPSNNAPCHNGWTVQSPVVAAEPVPVPMTSEAVSKPRENTTTVIINGWKVVQPAGGQTNGSGSPIQASPNHHQGASNGDVSRNGAHTNANGTARVTSPPIISVGWDDEAPQPSSVEQPSSRVTPAAAWDPNSVKIPSPGYPAASKGRSPHNSAAPPDRQLVDTFGQWKVEQVSKHGLPRPAAVPQLPVQLNSSAPPVLPHAGSMAIGGGIAASGQAHQLSQMQSDRSFIAPEVNRFETASPATSVTSTSSSTSTIRGSASISSYHTGTSPTLASLASGFQSAQAVNASTPRKPGTIIKANAAPPSMQADDWNFYARASPMLRANPRVPSASGSGWTIRSPTFRAGTPASTRAH